MKIVSVSQMKIKFILVFILMLFGITSLFSFAYRKARVVANVNSDVGTPISIIWVTTQNLRLDTSLNGNNSTENSVSVPAREIESVTLGKIVNGQLTIYKINNWPSILWLALNQEIAVPTYYSLNQDNLFISTDFRGLDTNHSEGFTAPDSVVINEQTDPFGASEFYILPKSENNLRFLTYELAINDQNSLVKFSGPVKVSTADFYRLDIDATISEWITQLGFAILLFTMAIWVNKS